MKFPNTVSKNTYQAYINCTSHATLNGFPLVTNVQQQQQQQQQQQLHIQQLQLSSSSNNNNNYVQLNGANLDWDSKSPDTLQIICLNKIAEYWQECPIYMEIDDIEDRLYLLDILDLNISLKNLATHIQEDVFWQRFYQQRWPRYYPPVIIGKPWINIFMERYFRETIEQMKPCDYNEDEMHNLLDICAPYLENLQLQQLQPAMDEQNDHVPLDFILSNLNELKRFEITYDLKTIGTIFFLGCSNISKFDIKSLVSGLEKCYDLLEFKIHSSKLEPYMLKLLARALEKACSNLQLLSVTHSRCGDTGVVTFLDTISYDSFQNLKHLILSNNFISYIGATKLATVIKTRSIETLDLRLNPIGSDGAAALFGVLNRMPMKILNLSCCSINEEITVLLLIVLSENKTIQQINLSSNKLGPIVGEKISQITFSKQLQELDLRNTGIQASDKCIIDSAILENRDKL